MENAQNLVAQRFPVEFRMAMIPGFTDAAANIEKHPIALQLRYLQALTEVAAENNSTTIFPVPVDLLTPFLQKAVGKD